MAVFGSASDVGKSVVAAALCRVFRNTGFSVAPFKAQNMSNNSYVTAGGGEIGRAQAVQAECAGIAPTVDMNPLLLKPSTDSRSQMILHGKVIGSATAADFRKERSGLFAKTQESLEKLRAAHDVIVIEGAGSCAEMNLKDYDLANFNTAIACGAPVLLVADIGRGGVFAQVIGTLDLLSPAERAMVAGVIINRFRGDVSLFGDGIDFIERRSGVPVLGVLPYLQDMDIDPEDSVTLETIVDPPSVTAAGKINIAVIRLPRISNFTDFAPFMREPSVNLSYLSKPRSLDGVDVLILPGSKSTIADLDWLREAGWEKIIGDYAKTGGRVIGVCGGYQMLGQTVNDPHGVEGKPGSTRGLGLLDARTTLEREKRLERVRARWVEGGLDITGYEIHMGITEVAAGAASPIEMILPDGTARPEGAMSADGRVWGTYIHGVFDEPAFRRGFLLGINPDAWAGLAESSAATHKERQYDRLAEHFTKHVDTDKIIEITGVKRRVMEPIS